MIVLAFDTSCNACSICLWQDGAVLAKKTEIMERGQAEILIPEIDVILKQAGLTFKNIGLIAVTKGPGSFTGIRASLATARALSLASGTPVVGVSTLDVFAHMAKELINDELLLVAQESKRADLYYQIFDANLNPTSAEKSAGPEEIIKTIANFKSIIFGDASQHFNFDLPENVTLIKQDSLIPQIEIIAVLAYQQFNDNKEAITANPKDFYPNPIYIRPPDVSIANRQ